MPEIYGVALKIVVIKGKNEEIIVTEEYFFPGITFARMANVSDEFYELIAKLQKLK